MYFMKRDVNFEKAYNKLWGGPEPVSTTSSAPYKITGPMRINPVARAVRAALMAWAYADSPREVVEAKS